MLDKIHKIPENDTLSIKWEGNNLHYDLQLYELGQGLDEFWALTPNRSLQKYAHYIDDIPYSRKCIVFTYGGEWVVKLFKDGWYPYHGYETVEILPAKLAWTKNPEVDKLMTFTCDTFGNFDPDRWDRDYELVWYMDPRVNPLSDKVWAFSCRPIGKEVLGTKDMGYVMPDVQVEFSQHLPDLGVDIDSCYPAFYELDHECALELDPIHQTSERLWVVKFSPSWRRPRSWKWIGIVSPELHVEYNPTLPKLDYDLDYVIPWHDLSFKHVWMLDRKHLVEGEKDIWAFTVQVTADIEGSKDVGYISPTATILYNPNIPKIKYNDEYVVPWHDLEYEHVWYLETTGTKEKVWAVKATLCNEPIGLKEVGTVVPLFADQLDVIFISYKEPNADENWQRVLEKAPWAKRVHGVEGIFNAHKAAAKLAKTDMFFVVDGDAWLVDDWEFDFQPGIFDRDCAYVWSSINPVNNLIYQNGGVKLFSRKVLLRQKKWTTLDMFTGIMPKIKAEDRISCVTTFNMDEFSTWRSAFRECVKLYLSNQMSKLDEWLHSDTDKDYGVYAVMGATHACNYAKEFLNDQDALLKINDYSWLEQQFKGQRFD